MLVHISNQTVEIVPYLTISPMNTEHCTRVKKYTTYGIFPLKNPLVLFESLIGDRGGWFSIEVGLYLVFSLSQSFFVFVTCILFLRGMVSEY